MNLISTAHVVPCTMVDTSKVRAENKLCNYIWNEGKTLLISCIISQEDHYTHPQANRSCCVRTAVVTILIIMSCYGLREVACVYDGC